MAFIKVCNTHLSEKFGLTPKQLYVLSYLKYINQGREELIFRMKDFTDFVKVATLKIKYHNKDKESEIMRLKDKRTLAPILDELVELGLLEFIKDKSFTNDVKLTDLVKVKLKDRECDLPVDKDDKSKGFEPISTLFIEDYFAGLGYNGFAVYCFLKKNYIVSEEKCSYSLVDMQKVLLIDVKTIHTYLILLEELGLISSKSFHKYNHQVAYLNKGKEKMKGFSFKSNEYKVFAKYVKDDKYYVIFS